MLNSSHIQRKLENGPKLQYLLKNKSSNSRELIGSLYLMILSRPPTEEEFKTIAAYAQIVPPAAPVATGKKSKPAKTPSMSTKGRDAVIDVAWALINSSEFQYRH
jgi:hypothetical protein